MMVNNCTLFHMVTELEADRKPQDQDAMCAYFGIHMSESLILLCVIRQTIENHQSLYVKRSLHIGPRSQPRITGRQYFRES